MRHRVKTKKLSRNKASREALLRSLMRALILSQSIITTSAKAKEVKKFAERLISVAKKSSVNSHRRVFQRLADKKVVKKFFSEIIPQLEDKTGGNIRLIKTGKRKGDGADMSLIEFILVEKKEEKKGKKKGRMPRIRRKKPPKEKKKEEKTKKSEKK
ncbi:50S ribosomal protein L17 [candidate division WOR-3 bacterium]|nr:50S ribosomal protein L17 [candidate division WOR-3 bacterium]